MRCLSESGFKGTSLREALAHRSTTGFWPERTVVLTFDDGFANFYEKAWSVLQQYGFKATVFVISGYMGKQNDWAPPPPGLGMRDILSWEQATELSLNGMEIGSHTQTHRDLSRCSEWEVQREVIDSRAEIEDHLAMPVETFAYPYGATDPVSLGYVERTFQAACTTVLKEVNGEALHSLPRIDVYYLKSPGAITKLLDGQLNKYLAVRHWARVARRALLPSH